MRKFLLAGIMFILSMNLYSYDKDQSVWKPNKWGVSISAGCTTKNFIPVDIKMVTPSGFSLGINMTFQSSTGKKGEYYGTIGWDKFPEDHIKSGSYYQVLGVEVGYFGPKFYLLGILGKVDKIEYRNMYDSYHILSSDGYYHLTKGGTTSAYDFGLDFGIILWDRLLIGAQYTEYTWIGFKLGFVVYPK